MSTAFAMASPGPILNRREVAALLGLKDVNAAVRLGDKHPDFPRPFYTFARCPRWRKRDIEAWVNKHAKAAQVVPFLREVSK